VESWVFSGSLSSLWPASFGLSLSLVSVLSPLSWVLSFHKVWQGFIIIQKHAENKVIGKVS
jgi:hypothetical protein